MVVVVVVVGGSGSVLIVMLHLELIGFPPTRITRARDSDLHLINNKNNRTTTFICVAIL